VDPAALREMVSAPQPTAEEQVMLEDRVISERPFQQALERKSLMDRIAKTLGGWSLGSK
jgi:hypothetical protein